MDDASWTVDDELLATLGTCDERPLTLHERLVLADVLARRWELGE
jgi:hypothetical protein